MSRADGNKVELLEYPLFDTLMSGVGTSGLGPVTQLFASNTIGKPQFTNMQQASMIPSGGQFFVTSIRATSFFQSLADTEYTVAYGTIAAQTGSTSSVQRMLDCYNMLAYGAQVTLFVAQKPQIVVPWYYLPSGGGTYGFTTAPGRTIASNGVPAKDSVARFTSPVEVASLQAFTVQVNFYDFAKASVAGGFTGSGQSTTISSDLSPLQFLNQADGIKSALIVLGGATTRDIN